MDNKTTPKSAALSAEYSKIAELLNTVLFNGTNDHTSLLEVAPHFKSNITHTIYVIAREKQHTTLAWIWNIGKLDPKWKLKLEALETKKPVLDIKITECDLTGMSDKSKAKVIIAREKLSVDIERKKIKDEETARAALVKSDKQAKADAERRAKEKKFEKMKADRAAALQEARKALSPCKWGKKDWKDAVLNRSLWLDAGNAIRFYVPQPDESYEVYSKSDFEEALSIHADLPLRSKTALIAPAAEMRHAISKDNGRKLYGVTWVNFLKKGLMDKAWTNGRRMINTADDLTMKFTGGKLGKYGEHFPWIADHLLNFFGYDKDNCFQWELFNATLQRHLVGAYSKRPVLCPAIFFAGHQSSQKGLMTNGILGAIYGTSEDPTAWLLNKQNWNDNLTKAGILIASDPVIDEKDVRQGSRALKKFASESKMTKTERWTSNSISDVWALKVFTLNLDPVSRSALITHGLEDKVQAYRVYSGKADLGETEYYHAQAKIAAELPHYLIWLVSAFEPTERVLSKNPRYGVWTGLHPELQAESKYEGEVVTVREYVLAWQASMSGNWSKGTVWRGSATQLIIACELAGVKIPSRITDRVIGTGLTLIAAREDWVRKMGRINGVSTYQIDYLPVATETAATVGGKAA